MKTLSQIHAEILFCFQNTHNGLKSIGAHIMMTKNNRIVMSDMQKNKKKKILKVKNVFNLVGCSKNKTPRKKI